MLSEELRQRIIKEYEYAVTKMNETPLPARKLFYFSVFFGEAQRVFNWEWDSDLALIYIVTQHVHSVINAQQSTATLPIDWQTVFDKLTQVASELTEYFKNLTNEDNRKELCRILERFAEIAYSVSGNGSYLYEKGAFKL
jgi:hypothetical protein